MLFAELSKDFGKSGLATSLAPAIHYARAGVSLAPRTCFDWQRAASHLQGAAREYYLLNGRAPTPGQIFRAPKQADVLEKVAMQGRNGFYSGEVAEDMVASLNAAGGVHTLEDFEATACEYTTPVAGDYKTMELVEHPPNGQGAVAILMNNIRGHFDLPSMDPMGALRAHLEAEASKTGL